MVIKIYKSQDNTDNDLTITINGSELKIFNKMMKKWNLKDEGSLLKFCLGILNVVNDELHYNKDGSGFIITPADHLLKK